MTPCLILFLIRLRRGDLITGSLDKSITFYIQILGLKVDYLLGRHKGNIKIALGAGTYIELFPFEMYQARNQGALVHFALNVRCLNTAMAFLESKGAPILRGPFDIRCFDEQLIVRRVVFIQGPDGEEIELVQSV